MITDFLEGDAGRSVCERIRRHMVHCEKCRMYIDTHGRVIRLYNSWRDDRVPTIVSIRLMTRIEREMSGHGPKRR
jgi:predicted anti-sigma-YlaC factor YlaD